MAQVACRDSAPSPPTKTMKKGFYVMGQPAAGSTLIYNFCREIYQIYFDRFEEFKSHGYRDPKDLTAIAPYRDFRDSWVSLAKKDRPNGPEAFRAQMKVAYRYHVEQMDRFNIDKWYEDPRITLVKYEEYLPHDAWNLLEFLQETLGMKIPVADRQRIVEKFKIPNVLRYIGARGTNWSNFSQNHITNDGRHGAWKRHLSPDLICLCRDRFVPMLIKWGYEKDGAWAAIDCSKHPDDGQELTVKAK